MNLEGTVGGKGEVGRERGFSLTPQCKKGISK